MHPSSYLNSNFSDFQAGSRYELLSDGSKRIAKRTSRIFHSFMEKRFRGQAIEPDHIIAYMYYRVVGEKDEFDEHSGSVQLTTFLYGEVRPLLHKLLFDKVIDFDIPTLLESEKFKHEVLCIRRLTGEKSVQAHSRPIWPQDLERLRAALTLDTASKRDNALLILLARSGFRPASIAKLRYDIHVFDCPDGIEITLPESKTGMGMGVKTWLRGEDAEIMRRWIKHRKQIHSSSKALFITSSGGPITCDSTSRMIDRLGLCAGYGEGFFNAQSFRVGFANLEAAKVYAEGKSFQEVLDRLCAERNWKRGSQAVRNYLDPNVPNYFSNGRNLSLEEFLNLDPRVLHGLESLHEIKKRPLTYFCHSRTRLMKICANLGADWDWDEFICRENIGRKLCLLIPDFRQFLQACSMNARKSERQILCDIVGCLLEEDLFDICRVLEEPWRSEIMSAVAITEYRSNQAELKHASRSVQKLVVHNLRDRRRAHRLVQALFKRKSDRKCHLGKLPNGELVVLKVRRKEINCIEPRSLPFFDLNVHFPEDLSHTIIEETSDEAERESGGSVSPFIRAPAFEEDEVESPICVLDEPSLQPTPEYLRGSPYEQEVIVLDEVPTSPIELSPHLTRYAEYLRGSPHEQEVIVLDEDPTSPMSENYYRISESLLETPSTVASPNEHPRKK